MSRFPFPIPTGWFQVGFCHELEVGQVVPIRYFAKDLVLFRGEDGQARVLDAFCPHLGAHLGHGGKLSGNNVVCPFHAWEFDGQGRCARIPYTGKIPKQANMRAWPVLERNGQIMVWHDLAGREPHWEPPALEEYRNEEWTDYVTRRWVVKSCNQELGENAVDSAHFHYLHGTARMPKSKGALDGHHMHVDSDTLMTTPAGPVEGQIAVDCYGFGFTTTRFTGLVETLLVSSAAPIDRDHTELWFAFTVKMTLGRSISKGVGKAFVAEISRQLEQVIPIWENKQYLDRPVLCDGDGPIGLYRTWSRQFYPDGIA
jgi:3-ketosteroid 9alpha-monooxygenase subunit A